MPRLRRILSLVAALTLVSCLGPGTVGAGGISVQPFDFPDRVGSLDYMGGLALSGRGEFGGLSGLDISADGRTATAITDRGHWFTFALDYDPGGRLAGAALSGGGPLHNLRGKPVNRKQRDAEEVKAYGRGGFLVSFERLHRLWWYDKGLDQIPRVLPTPRAMASLPSNGGVEAMTPLPDGRILMLAEEGGEGDIAIGWLSGAPGGGGQGPAGQDWAPVRYRCAPSFVPTSVAVLPNGDLLVLERSFAVWRGFSSRLNLVPAARIRPGALLEGREIALIDKPLPTDNFEGLAVRRQGDETFVYIISDDNFSLLQSNLLLMFKLRI